MHGDMQVPILLLTTMQMALMDVFQESCPCTGRARFPSLVGEQREI
jgi:hypothetical protein